MSNKIIGYDDQLWRVEQEFSYTGTDQPFTLQPGTYLFICEGAHGGIGLRGAKEYGGVVFGEITLNETTTFHAVVGSDGGDYNSDYTKCVGGFNGGAHGGLAYSSSYVNGPGGGGATDIRLLPYDANEYPIYDETGNIGFSTLQEITFNNITYTQLEYITSFGGTNSGYFNTGYIPKTTTRIEMDCVYHENTIKLYQTLFGCKGGTNAVTDVFQFFVNNSIFHYARGDSENVANTDEMILNERMRLVCDIDKAQWFFNDTLAGTILATPTATVQNNVCPLIINNCNRATSNTVTTGSDFWCKMNLYDFKIYEDETLIKHFVPVKRQSDNVVGLFDIVNDAFITQTGSGYWEAGPPKTNHPSLDSRIMVAAGAGGGNNSTNLNQWYDGYSYGGGPYGSQCPAGINKTDATKDPFGNIIPTQTWGYGFGYGCFPNKRIRTNSGDGAGGGGGGWFGGFASVEHTQSTSGFSKQGGGGSSYVLTSSSHKPEGYNPDSKYYFTKILLHGYQAMGDLFSDNPTDWNNGHVYICKPTAKLQQGDIIVYPSTGASVTHQLPSGQYQLKCWGGDGGARCYTANTVRGGYSEGVLNTNETHQIYVYTGGSGWPLANFGNSTDQTNLITMANLPSLGFNGGHHIQNLTTILSTSGGASDIRFDEDDMYHRVIVAGGAGSEGMVRNKGGAGGGTTGDFPIGNYGTNEGPGTQTSGYAFGDGGLGYYQSNGYGGCGGGGWYGGYGTTPNGSSDNDKGGAGGSGFVLTENTIAYTPSEYGCNDTEYYLTQAQTVQGGNNLPIAHTKVQIEVLQLQYKCLCQDSDGYKYFDREQGQWTLLPSQSIMIETFDMYGSGVRSDAGLKDPYTILIYDESQTVSALKLNVTPNTQTVSSILDTQVLSVIKAETEDEYPDGVYQSWVQTSSVNVNDESKTKVILYIDKLQNVDAKYRAYYSQILTAKTAHENEYLKLDEKGNRIFKHFIYDENGNMRIEERTMELKPRSQFINEMGEVIKAQWLLPVMTKNNIPVVYNNQIIDGDVTSIYITMIGQYARTIYLAYICNVSGVANPQLIIKGMNFTTGSVVNVCRLDWSTVIGNYSTYYVHTLLIDQNYFYLIEASNSVNRQKIIRIHKQTFTVSTTDSCGEDICTYGKMEWYDDHTIICIGKQKVNLFDINDLVWRSHPLTENSDKYDWCMGKKYLIWTHSRDTVYIYDIENNFAFEKTITFTVSGTTGTSLVMCYHDGTFYIATGGSVSTGGHIITLDEATLTFTNRVTSGLIYPYECRYCNGGVIISQYNDYRLLCYDIETNRTKYVYTPWKPTEWKKSKSVYVPFVLDGVYFWLMNTLLILNYSPSSKYNFGQKYNIYYTYYGETYDDGLEYDERFITVTPSSLEFHDGILEYELSEYDENHITTVTIQKSSYKYLNNIIIE